jgi:starch synthase (maltosyl-transferring)
MSPTLNTTGGRMRIDGRKRVVIENVQPCVNGGEFPIKRIVGEGVKVQADIFADGHDEITALLLYRKADEKNWTESFMSFIVNDLWEAEFVPAEMGVYEYTVEAWIERFKTWQHDIQKKIKAGQNVEVDVLIGAQLIKEAGERAAGEDAKKLRAWANDIESEKEAERLSLISLNDPRTVLMKKYPDRSLSTRFETSLQVSVERNKALFSAWYEIFPRSFPDKPGEHGTFKSSEKLLPQIADLGFDVLYFPPIHPIGKTNRKGKNNSSIAKPGDPGSPWAIGGKEGGYKAIHPELGSEADFVSLVKRANELGIEIALDLAYQCSPDHPYVKSHPEWFRWRPDGTVQFAENPPKKYQDVLPINFETDNWKELWEELKSVVEFWIDKGVKIFRVDNPHTKPFAFWEWMISDLKSKHRDLIFLAEAFTRPKVMYRLAKVGFTQSYTYFTWRNTKQEFIQYLTELTKSEVREFFRPNFWPNTPDILPEHLQFGGRPAFISRLILAGTLSSNYGMYAPAFEQLVHEPLPGREEYANSEKYEIINWNLDQPGNLRPIIKKLNQIRKENAALQTIWNIEFLDIDNDYLLCYSKKTPDYSNIIVVAVNLDYFHIQAGSLKIPLQELGIPEAQPYLVHELLSDSRFIWQGRQNYIELNPDDMPVKIFRLQRRLRREQDFDYFM